MLLARLLCAARPAADRCPPIVILMLCSFAIVPASAFSDAFLFEPSVGLDQRFDDNFLLNDSSAGSLTATRVFAEINGSREGRTAAYRAQARIDQELVNGDGQAEGADSDRYLELETVFRAQRLRYGAIFGYRKDSTSRDISSDLTDDDDLSSDPSLVVTQPSNVDRQEFTIEPTIEYDFSQRTLLEASLEYKQVDHGLPYPRDAIFRQYQLIRENQISNEENPGPPIPFDELTIDDVGSVFSPSGELADFSEINLELGARFKLSEISAFRGTIEHKEYTGRVEPDPFAIIPFEALESDPDQRDIRRKPRRDSLSSTSTFRLGYEQELSQILKFDIEGGLYRTDIDKTDTLRDSDRPGEEIPEDRLASLTSEDEGWLANLTMTRDDGVLRLEGKYAVDVRTSSNGSQVESAELTGDASWKLNPRTVVALRARAYEPRRIDPLPDVPDGALDELGNPIIVVDEDSRRLLSIEPRISWRYSRAWTLSAAYRYRRQRFRFDEVSSDSNALLFTIRYTPPSALRAAADSDGF